MLFDIIRSVEWDNGILLNSSLVLPDGVNCLSSKINNINHARDFILKFCLSRSFQCSLILAGCLCSHEYPAGQCSSLWRPWWFWSSAPTGSAGTTWTEASCPPMRSPEPSWPPSSWCSTSSLSCRYAAPLWPIKQQEPGRLLASTATRLASSYSSPSLPVHQGGTAAQSSKSSVWSLSVGMDTNACMRTHIAQKHTYPDKTSCLLLYIYYPSAPQSQLWTHPFLPLLPCEYGLFSLTMTRAIGVFLTFSFSCLFFYPPSVLLPRGACTSIKAVSVAHEYGNVLGKKTQLCTE